MSGHYAMFELLVKRVVNKMGKSEISVFLPFDIPIFFEDRFCCLLSSSRSFKMRLRHSTPRI